MYSLLIVEDEAMIRCRLRDFYPWNEWRFTVSATAANGLDALEVIKAKRPDAILMDIRMPVMDGIELMGRLEEMGCDCPKVVLSGYSDFAYAKQAIEHGCIDYVLKPVTENDLKRAFEKVSRALTLRRQLNAPMPNPVSRIAPALSYIEHCYDCQITPHELAALCSFSLAQFYRIFKEEINMTVVGYINQVRMERAKRLLTQRGIRIDEVSYAVGFTDPRYFSRVFTRAVGMTPLEYREEASR